MLSRRALGVSMSAVALMLGLSIALLAGKESAAAGRLFVTPRGTGTNCLQASPCALATALDKARDGDEIVLARGTYVGTGSAVVTLTKSISLLGGWDGRSFGQVKRDRDAYPSVLDGQNKRRVIYVGPDTRPTIDGLIIHGGDASGLIGHCYGTGGDPDGCGGGIFGYRTDVQVTNNVIEEGVAASTTGGPTGGTTGYGGGIYLGEAEEALIRGNLIARDVGSTIAWGAGGGIYLYHCAANSIVEENQIIENTATASSRPGWGGGIGAANSSAIIRNNHLEGNIASTEGEDYGDGIFTWYSSGPISGNYLTKHSGSEAVYLGYYTGAFEGNRVERNSASGVLVAYRASPAPRLVNNIVARNGQGLSNVRVVGSSGYPVQATLLQNTIVGDKSGPGLTADFASLTLVNNIFAGCSQAIYFAAPAHVTLNADHNLFWSNGEDGPRGTKPVLGDPRFVSPATGNWMLGFGSAATDAGANTGITKDIDGHPRPAGDGYDIGAYEFRATSVYLPLASRP